jgi:hypothetical protein
MGNFAIPLGVNSHRYAIALPPSDRRYTVGTVDNDGYIIVLIQQF